MEDKIYLVYCLGVCKDLLGKVVNECKDFIIIDFLLRVFLGFYDILDLMYFYLGSLLF